MQQAAIVCGAWVQGCDALCDRQPKETYTSVKRDLCKCVAGMCNRQPSYAAPGAKAATHCALHKLEGQVDVKNMRYRCRNPAGCNR